MQREIDSSSIEDEFHDGIFAIIRNRRGFKKGTVLVATESDLSTVTIYGRTRKGISSALRKMNLLM